MCSYTNTVKSVYNGHSQKDRKLVFNRFMQIKSIAAYSEGGILQYFWSPLSYHLSLRSLFCLFLSGRLHRLYYTIYSMVNRPVSRTKYN